MRPQGTGLLVWTAITLLFALTTGGAFPWYLFYFLAGVWAVAAGWAWSIARSLHVEAHVDRATATAGDTVTLTVKVENDSLLPIPRLVMIHSEPGQRGRASDPRPTPRPWGEVHPSRPVPPAAAAGTPTTQVAPPSPAARPEAPAIQFRQLGPLDHWTDRRPVQLDRRGRYPLGPVLVEAYDPLGLFCIRRITYAHPPLTVFPRPLPVPQLRVALRHPFGRQPARAKAWQDPSSLSDVRPFRPGDNPKHIHWKLTARLGELHVKEFDLRATTDCFAFLDLEESVQRGSGLLSTAETTVALTAGLAVALLQRDVALGAFAHTQRLERLPPGRGSRHLRQAMRWLVELGEAGRVSLADLLASQRALLTPRSVVVVITPHLSTPLAGQLLQLRQQGHPVELWLLEQAADGPTATDRWWTGTGWAPNRHHAHVGHQAGNARAAGAAHLTADRRLRTLAASGVHIQPLNPEQLWAGEGAAAPGARPPRVDLPGRAVPAAGRWRP